MSTIVIRVDVTWTTTSAGGYTKTTLPANPAAGINSARTLDFPDPALQAIAEEARKKVVQLVQALDPNANANCTISTSTVT
jgi:hypothetical protein